MTNFHLDEQYAAEYFPLRTTYGYVAKGCILHRGEVVDAFVAHARSIPDIEKYALAAAKEAFARLIKAQNVHSAQLLPLVRGRSAVLHH